MRIWAYWRQHNHRSILIELKRGALISRIIFAETASQYDYMGDEHDFENSEKQSHTHTRVHKPYQYHYGSMENMALANEKEISNHVVIHYIYRKVICWARVQSPSDLSKTGLSHNTSICEHVERRRLFIKQIRTHTFSPMYIFWSVPVRPKLKCNLHAITCKQ